MCNVQSHFNGNKVKNMLFWWMDQLQMTLFLLVFVCMFYICFDSYCFPTNVLEDNNEFFALSISPWLFIFPLLDLGHTTWSSSSNTTFEFLLFQWFILLLLILAILWSISFSMLLERKLLIPLLKNLFQIYSLNTVLFSFILNTIDYCFQSSFRYSAPLSCYDAVLIYWGPDIDTE